MHMFGSEDLGRSRATDVLVCLLKDHKKKNEKVFQHPYSNDKTPTKQTSNDSGI